MESTFETELSDARSECVSAKRPAAEDEHALTEKEDSPPRKRSKGLIERNLGRGEVKKVAEIVMVLAALGKMRGGRGATYVEKELMAEARDKLAKVCEGFAPSDVFPSDAFGGLIENLGLNKLNEQRLGFLPPKLSLADKLLVSKRKMEKAEDFSRQPSKDSSQGLLANSGAAVGIYSASVPVKMSQLSKPNQMSVSTGNYPYVSPLSHVSTSNATSLLYQLPSSEVRPSVVSSVLPSGQLGSLALQQAVKPHLRVDGRSNGSGANYSANSTVRTATWSFQQQTVSAAKIGPDNKVPVTVSLKVEGAANVKSGLPSQATPRTVIAQAAGPPSQGFKYAQASVGNVHAEIGKIVQKLLQPQVPDHPTWIPPSRDYMSKAVTCELCSSTVSEIDSILICDSCEKGYHLKCLQTSNQKGVSKPEWHCEKCLSLSSGKPLPPKYGKVMRNTNTPNLSSNSAGVLSNLSKMFGDSVEKVGLPKTTIISTPSMQNDTARIEGNTSNDQIPGSQSDVTRVQENGNMSSSSNTNDKIAFETYPNIVMKVPHSASVSLVNSSMEETSEEKIIKIKSISSKLEKVSNSFQKPETVVIAQYGNPRSPNDDKSQLKQSFENHVMGGDSYESHGDKTSNIVDPLKEQEVVHDNHSEMVGSTDVIIQDRSSFDDLNAVDWVGDPIQVSDDKIFYAFCRISGHLYRAMDHVLVHFEKGKLIPSKLRALWEDKNTKMKWVTINRCYFPDDLPEAVGRPCGLENSEVIESSCGRTLMAGLIGSPCEVLSPRKFAKESERRSHPGTQQNDRLPPLYLCKWIYDEAKRLFRDVSC